MKVFMEPPNVASRSLGRVEEALKRFAPPEIKLETVKWPSQADLVIFHVIGRLEQVTEAAANIKRRGGRYAIIQYCVRSTQKPDTTDWILLWRDAALVWSYYDLNQLCEEDGVGNGFHFYHAPLGVDTTVFGRRWWQEHRPNVILTSGQSRLTESVRECVMAARHARRTVVHLGPELRYGEDVRCYSGLEDEQLAAIYNECEFTSGLRRIEGFELPAAEGLLCGARPIMFDKPHYKHWYGDWAYYIPELDREGVLECLKFIFDNEKAKPVTDEEWENAAALFNWPRLIGDFWRQLA